ncbi:MAG: hypothetical protein V4858_19880 [Pseudomonadota bacterium]
METLHLSRHRSIERHTSQHAETTAGAPVELWYPLATQIIAIVGANGFDSLYARAVSLTQAWFPWLAASVAGAPVESRFADLKASLENKTPELASEANRVLLITFTDILASLIGEPLTARMLETAWGNGVLSKADKDCKNG